MDWNFVKVFLAIYCEGTIAGAGKVLAMSESTLFRHLTNYEKTIGKLFIRQNGEYSLTDLGKDLLSPALKISESFSDIDRRIFASSELNSSPVRITAPTSFSYGYLPSLIEQLKIKQPEIDIELVVSNNTLCLNTRQADIAIRVTNAPPDNFIGNKVKEIKWGVYGGYGYLSKNGVPETISSLNKHCIIGGVGDLLKHKAFTWVANHLGNSVTIKTDDLVAMYYLAENNHGLAILPDEFNRGNIKRLFTIDDIGVNTLWVLTHSDFRNVERVRLAARYLAEGLAQV